ncbi:tyrosine-protein kinase Yes-like [Homarus americanus]|uniref:Tyrosine-protein kinase yes-like 2 n=1 Tax=Homarus americanus TaxID=6706 RepID=A0A8J5MTE9_HOMAM|nr:tyrosine-protein kinase Yes-like [Homarus americanus]KAG7163250.1 Tyrosine-protein kinase yes-like 2 [Homarus americanus]KAG7163253.1 Tyrosine-protein kinase yes-like 3 [Homarus americanus]
MGTWEVIGQNINMEAVRDLYWDEVENLVQNNICVLGTGTHGTAYLVRWGGETAVLKVAHKSHAVRSFWQETEALLRLDGAGGAPRVTGFCNDPPAILQEFKGLVTLEDILNQLHDERETRYNLIEVGLRIGEQLEDFHRSGLIHNDLKRDNILVHGSPSNPQVSIIDVGLACYSHENIRCNSDPNKFPWMAPEVCLGQESTRASDTYSYGVLLSKLAVKAPGYHPDVFALALQATEYNPYHRISLPSLLHRLRGLLRHNQVNVTQHPIQVVMPQPRFILLPMPRPTQYLVSLYQVN